MSAFTPPLKGMMVGNGVTNWKYDGTPGAFEMAWWHSLLPREIYQKSHQLNCKLYEVPMGRPDSPECDEVAGAFDSLFGSDDPNAALVNIYDIFGMCWGAGSGDYGAEEY